MKIYTTKTELLNQLSMVKIQGKTLGFVPTMGALHNGHISLVEKSNQQSDYTVVSIFVNPTQFNNPDDLERYPRTLEKDINILKETGCQCVFAPKVDEMYPKTDNRQFDFAGLDSVMEGKFRKGHFNGVAQIVSKLFEIVKPDKAYFGQKDFQQLVIIKNLTTQLGLPVEIVPCPIIREANGLAMSSRNELLGNKIRKEAGVIFNTLKNAVNLSNEKSVDEIKDYVKNIFERNHDFDLEYFEIVDDETLQPIDSWAKRQNTYGCIAVYTENIRLIDNISFKR